MATHTGADPQRAPVPAGWPGDDPTLREELSPLGHVPAAPRSGPGSADDAGAGRGDPGPRPGSAAGDRVLPDEADPPDDHVPSDPGADPDAAAADEPGALRAEAHDADPADEPDADRAGEHDEVRPAAADGPDEPDGLDDEELDAIAGVQPAGRVLVVMVAALVLAMLVNADALVERAERRPPSASRDRALAVWHPVQDLSHVLQLYRIRDLADRLAGDDSGSDDDATTPAARPDAAGGLPAGDAPPDAAGGAADADDAADQPPAEGDGGAPFTLRTPTADEPLRLLVGGDFTAQVLGESLVAAGDATGVVEGEVHYESASGLTRSDYYDWPEALEDDVDEHEPDVLVVVFGANDAQGIVLDDGTPVQVDDPRWAEAYGRRVGDLMDQVRADDRMVVWVGQPPMRDPDYAARMAALNRVYAGQAATRPWVTFVDPATVVGGQGGAYAETVSGPDGEPVAVRQADGIHLAPGGGDMLASHVLGLVRQHVDLDQ